MKRVTRKQILSALTLIVIASSTPAQLAAAEGAAAPRTRLIKLPGGEAGIGFDDLQYAARLKKIIVPGGRTGKLFLIDPASGEVTSVDGFSAKKAYSGGHGDGTTSACEGGDFIYATDRGSSSIKIVDPSARKLVGSISLAGSPDYVRYVAATREVWVTEPGKEQIEILALSADGRAARSVGKVAASGGPESLIIDATRSQAYTHTWINTTYAVDLKKRAIASTWTNDCKESRGIALDEKRGLLFVGCAEGKALVMDVTTGKVLSSLKAGSDVDSIGYAAELRHLYVPGGGTSDLSILDASDGAHLAPLGMVKTGPDAHTAAFDPESRQVFVGLPEHGEVLVTQDGAGPASR